MSTLVLNLSFLDRLI